MKEFDPKELSIPETHRLLLGGVAPRPIALVASIDKDGNHNLSPFSFFNAFGANPPIIAFSPAYSGRDGKAKDTYLNILETKEFTVSIVSHAMVEQINLASAEYPHGVDEFIKSGLTKLQSRKISPPGVAESMFVMECKLYEYVALGGKPSSGNLIIGEVIYFHVKESAFHDGKIDPTRMDQVARMGGDWYSRAREGMFPLPKPKGIGIGIDALPENVRTSSVLTGNDLARLAGIEKLPNHDELKKKLEERLERAKKLSVDDFETELEHSNPDGALALLMEHVASGERERHQELFTIALHRLVQGYLKKGDVDGAWEVIQLTIE